MTKHFSNLNDSDLNLVCGGSVNVAQTDPRDIDEPSAMQDLETKGAGSTSGGTGGDDDQINEQLNNGSGVV